MSKIRSVEERTTILRAVGIDDHIPAINELVTQDRQAFEEATMQVIDDYFKGLVAIPDPQATKESIKEAVRAIYQGNNK